MTSRVRWIEHLGTRILVADFTQIAEPEELRQTIEYGKSVVAREPLDSIRSVLLVRGLRFNPQTIEWIKEGMAHNTPYVRASAVVGMSALQRVAFIAIQRIRGRKVKAFETQEAAFDWLSTHP
jgi:hypothetical protein